MTETDIRAVLCEELGNIAPALADFRGRGIPKSLFL